MKSLLSRLCAAIDRANEWGAWFAAACCAALAAMLIVEVGVTSKVGWSQPWAVEYASYLCAVTLFGGAGYALRHSSHIRVAVALEYFPQPLVRVLDFVCTAGAIAITGILAYGFYDLAARSFERGSKSYFTMQTPLWIPQGMLAIGVFLLLAALIARAIRILIGEAPDLIEERAAGEGAAE